MPMLSMSSCLLPEGMRSWIANFLIVLLLPRAQHWLHCPSFWGEGNRASDLLFFWSSETGYFPCSGKYMCSWNHLPFPLCGKMHTCSSCHDSWSDPKVCYFKPRHLVMCCSPSSVYSALPKGKLYLLGSSPAAESSLAQAVLSVKIIRLKMSLD